MNLKGLNGMNSFEFFLLVSMYTIVAVFFFLLGGDTSKSNVLADYCLSVGYAEMVYIHDDPYCFSEGQIERIDWVE